MSGPRCHPARRIALAVVAVASMLAATACGGDGGGGSGGAVDDADAKPVAGGKAVYGVEADNSGGFCLPEAELAISGWLVAMSVYDPLVYPNADGKMVPYLAESVTPNGDATQWTIRLRDGITFHDGTPLDAETVKVNLDSYRGANPELRPLLAAVIFQEIADVVTTDPRTVVVTTVRPWWAFPSYLFLNGRMGIAARSQLTNRDTCARDLVGTGPFRLKGDWTPGTPIELERNPDYWRTDAAGQRLPYLDQLTFVGVAEQSQRINQLEGSQLQLAHSSQSHDLNKFRELERRGAARVYVAEQGREVHYHLLNAGREPFSDPEAREAFALAVDRDKLNALLNEGNATLANGPFDVGVPGHLDTLEGPAYDPARAEQLVAAVKQRHGGEFHVTFAVNPDQNSQTEAQLLEQQVKEVGIDVTIERVDQSTEINRGLAGDFDVLLWRLHAGEDPDTQYIWWHSRSPTNFNHFADDEIDRDLDEARVTQDADVRREHYEAVNRRFAEQLYNVWAWYVDWAVATNPRVHGVLGPPLPDGSEPYPLLAGLHPTLGLWIFAMTRYAGKLVRLVVVLLLVTFGAFMLVRVLPGDPVEKMIPFGVDVETERAQLREELGLDEPVFTQYVDWLGGLLTGDLGTDYVTRTPITTILKSALPVTLQLMLYAQLLALLVAIPLGVLAAYRQGTWFDKVSNTTAFGFLAVPEFVLGLYLAYFIGARLNWLPAGGYVRLGDDVGGHFRSMALPVITLAAAQVAIYMRLLRSDMIATLQEDFIVVARSMGLRDRQILWRHALRPSSLTLLTVAGLNVGALIGGAVVIENIFGLPGIGTEIYKAIVGQQYVALQSYVALIAVTYVLVNFFVDFLYTVLDPRIRDAHARA